MLVCGFSSLQSFNNRTHELVLRAGAMESVGLKTITARHLGEFVCRPASPLGNIAIIFTNSAV